MHQLPFEISVKYKSHFTKSLQQGLTFETNPALLCVLLGVYMLVVAGRPSCLCHVECVYLLYFKMQFGKWSLKPLPDVKLTNKMNTTSASIEETKLMLGKCQF